MFDTDPVAYLHPSLYEQTQNCPDNIKPGDYFIADEWHPRPDFAIEFDAEKPGWIVDDAAALQHAKGEMITAIDAKTSELIHATGFEFSGVRFSMSDNAQKNWTMLAAARANGMMQFPYPVSALDESTFVLKSDNELLGFLAAYATYQADPSKPLGSGRTLKARVAACASIDEVDAIVDDRE